MPKKPGIKGFFTLFALRVRNAAGFHNEPAAFFQCAEHGINLNGESPKRGYS